MNDEEIAVFMQGQYKQYYEYVKYWNKNKHYKGVGNLMSFNEWYNHRLIQYRQNTIFRVAEQEIFVENGIKAD